MENQAPAFKWPPLESNPEVFTDYMRKVGLPEDWIINECFGLDDDCLSFVPQPTLAVIAVFESLVKDGSHKEMGDLSLPVPFYMKQTENLDYACGVIACIHSILNNLNVIKLEEGSILDKYFKIAKDKSAHDRAITLEGMEDFKAVHAASASEGQTHVPESGESVNHHFIAFVRTESGQLIELDGMKKGPVVLIEKSEDLLKDTAKILLKRVEDGLISESIAVQVLCKKPAEE